MCESTNPEKYSRRKVSIADDNTEESEEKIEDAFTKLSANTIAKLIEDEPDAYSIEDVKETPFLKQPDYSAILS